MVAINKNTPSTDLNKKEGEHFIAHEKEVVLVLQKVPAAESREQFLIFPSSDLLKLLAQNHRPGTWDIPVGF